MGVVLKNDNLRGQKHVCPDIVLFVNVSEFVVFKKNVKKKKKRRSWV